MHTRQFPWLGLIKINLSHGVASEAALVHLGHEAESDYLLITGVEAESWRQLEATATTADLLRLLLAVSHGSGAP